MLCRVSSIPSQHRIFNGRVVPNSYRKDQIKFCRFSSTVTPNPIDVSKIQIELTTTPKKKTPWKELLFGREFSDHMLEIDWKRGEGWSAPKISPYHNLSLEPSALVFHYALEFFEGMKAYKDSKGKIRLFRPEKNMERMNNSASRLAMPNFNGNEYLECLKKLLILDKDWIPHEKGYSLYIRPTMIATTPMVGVNPTSHAKFFTILSPVGPYYPSGFKPVKLFANNSYVRAWPGGTGCNKVGGNYAAGIMPQQEAAKLGFTQILWLFGADYQVTEVGTMNMFVFWINENGDKELITAPLTDGTILPGVTRDSMLHLAREWNEFKVTEGKFTIHDVIKALKEERVLEAFGAGTAAVVAPVDTIHFDGTNYEIPLDKSNPEAGIGPLAKRFVDRIMEIQYGEIQHKWSVRID